MSLARETHQTINSWQREHEGMKTPREALISLEMSIDKLKEVVNDDIQEDVFSSEAAKEILEAVAEVRIAAYRLADIQRFDADRIVDEVMNVKRNRKATGNAGWPST